MYYIQLALLQVVMDTFVLVGLFILPKFTFAICQSNKLNHIAKR